MPKSKLAPRGASIDDRSTPFYVLFIEAARAVRPCDSRDQGKGLRASDLTSYLPSSYISSASAAGTRSISRGLFARPIPAVAEAKLHKRPQEGRVVGLLDCFVEGLPSVSLLRARKHLVMSACVKPTTPRRWADLEPAVSEKASSWYNHFPSGQWENKDRHAF